MFLKTRKTNEMRDKYRSMSKEPQPTNSNLVFFNLLTLRVFVKLSFDTN
jgi:hypothetical protein